jgi:phage terminase large subunit-like protein
MVRFLKLDSLFFDKMVELHDSFNNSKIFSREYNSKFIPIASDSKTLDGLRPNCAIIDEFHESTDDSVLRNLESGMVNRAQPLLFIITTAGFNINGACYQYRKVVTDIVEGKAQDDSTLGVIFTLDDNDDWKDPAVRIKANPSLGTTPTHEAMDIAMQRALNEGQSSEVNFKTKNLNIWVRQSKTWIPDHVWMECAKYIEIDAFKGRRAFAAFDLSSNRDLTAFGLLFPPDDDQGDFVFICRYWIPEDNVEARVRKDRVPYMDWHRAGILEYTEGNITDQRRIGEAVSEAATLYDLESIYYDRWQATKLATELADQGARVVPFAQTVTNFNEPIRMIEELISTKRFAHNGDEVLRWMVGNVAMKYWNGLCKFDKDKSREKIDGLVVMAMCFAGYLSWLAKNGESVYADRDLFML